MDKLSNKLRLVRSQSMGVGVGNSGVMSAGDKSGHNGGGGHGGAAHGMRRTPAHTAEGRSASIVLLDERRLEMLVQPRLYAGELLDLVASHCQLKEKEYFGLAVVDESGHYTWLQLDRKVLDHDLPRKPATLTVHFLVKFFIESMSHLAENRTIELFYLQARSLIFRGALEAEPEIVFQLAALSLQAAYGDFVDEPTTRSMVKKSPILPANVLKEHPSMAFCEDQVIEHYQKMRGQTRGQAVVNYMTIVESMPTYGVHYFEVYDKRQSPWWLGLSCRGIAQYAYGNRRVPVRVFPWKQLENLYFRDKKFSIEVHDAKRVVQTLSSSNVYEDALKAEATASSAGSQPGAAAGKPDELVDAIADSTTQVSVSRRSVNPGNIHVYVWFGKTQGLTKCIWQSAISQHQFYLDRKQAKIRQNAPPRTLKEIARNLTQSTASLSSASSMSNLSRSGSTHSLAISAGGGAASGPGGVGAGARPRSGSISAVDGGAPKGAEALSIGSSSSAAGAAGGTASATGTMTKEQKEEAKRAKMEMVAALKARRDALEAKLKEKQKVLKDLCIKEGELTGELPPEIPLAPGEPVPQIRRRVGTAFALSENLLKKPQSPEEELLASLELEYEIQAKITSAAQKLSEDKTSSKSVRKARKISYQQSRRKLSEIETKLNALKYFGTKHKRKQPRHPGEADNNNDRKEGTLGRGVSVPDLDGSRSGGGGGVGGRGLEDSFEEDEVDSLSPLSPRSCPASPRKPSLMQNHPDSASLENSPSHRLAQLASTGYIPSSVYLRSSYRTKQYPTLSSAAAGSPNSTNVAAHIARQHHQIHSLQQQQQAQVQMHHNHHHHPHRPQSTSSSNLDMVDAAGRSATLPSSPFRNKYESHLTQCDSPVGLYNCPQQRTSQAFSSMDDLDAMVQSAAASGSMSSRRSSAAHMPPPPPMTAALSSHPKHQQQMQFPMVRLEAAAAARSGNVYPSLERSIVRGNAKPYKMANRELPALPTQQDDHLRKNSAPPRPPPVGIKPLKTATELARSMEDLDVLEAAGIRGRSKMNYREVGAMNGGDSVSLADAMLNKLNMAAHRQQQHQTHPHHLRNNEEYPPHLSPAAATATPVVTSNHAGVGSAAPVPAGATANAVGSHNMLGIRPLETGGPYPTPLTSATLLPGQTYPEPAVATASIASLQDVFYNHHAHAHHQRQVSALSVAVASSSKQPTTVPSVVGGGREEGQAPPPPLYPKQYHHVVEQRRRSGLGEPLGGSASSNGMPVPPRSIVSESPAVNRKVKPVMSTPPAPTTPTSSSSSSAAAPPLPPTPSSSVKRHNQLDESFENVPPIASSLEDSPAKPGAAANKFVPYRETTKPFEMADFYKYSTKYRKASASSLKDGVEGSGHESASNDSKRSSTASGGSSGHHSAAGQPAGPPEIPARANSNSNAAAAPGQPPAKADLGEDFSSEMLAWYNKQKGVTPAVGSGSSAGSASNVPSDPNKPATLV